MQQKGVTRFKKPQKIRMQRKKPAPVDMQEIVIAAMHAMYCCSCGVHASVCKERKPAKCCGDCSHAKGAKHFREVEKKATRA